jgi:hypothetical protein
VDARKCRPTRVLTELPRVPHAAAAREGLRDASGSDVGLAAGRLLSLSC